jgi:hypothetical protein
MLTIEKSTWEITGLHPDEVPDEVLNSNEPLLLKGMVAQWPVVQAARESSGSADRYLRRFYQNATVGAFFGAPDTAGRVFYNKDMTGFNFQRVMLKLDEILDKIQQHSYDDRPPAFYVGSTTVDTCLPGFRADNDIEFGDIDPLASIWLGNRTRVAAHYDVPDNIACCAVGRRRFTLFPPSEIDNLYPGPLDFTPAGQVISLVDFQRPDYDKHPRFRDALKNAQVAEMEPGDAIFIPSMWWHHVEGLSSFNVLINYWWRQSPPYMDTPVNVLNHALLTLRDLPRAQRQAWQALFNYYIFNFDEENVAHIPEECRGVLSPMDEMKARKLRAQLLGKLNR